MPSFKGMIHVRVKKKEYTLIWGKGMVFMFGKVSPNKSIRTADVSQLCYGCSVPITLQWRLGLCPGLSLQGTLPKKSLLFFYSLTFLTEE